MGLYKLIDGFHKLRFSFLSPRHPDIVDNPEQDYRVEKDTISTSVELLIPRSAHKCSLIYLKTKKILMHLP